MIVFDQLADRIRSFYYNRCFTDRANCSSWLRPLILSFPLILALWLLTVTGLMNKLAAIWFMVLHWASWKRISRSRLLNLPMACWESRTCCIMIANRKNGSGAIDQHRYGRSALLSTRINDLFLPKKGQFLPKGNMDFRPFRRGLIPIPGRKSTWAPPNLPPFQALFPQMKSRAWKKKGNKI